MDNECNEPIDYALLQQKFIAAEESREYFKTIFNSFTDAIFIHDSTSYNIVDVNNAACQMYGYTTEELRKLSVGSLSPGDYKCNQMRVYKKLEKVLKEGAQTFEWQAKKKNGTLFWVEINICSFDIIGRVYLFVTIRDITKRKNFERRLSEAKEEAERLSTIKTQFLSNMSHELRTPLNGIVGFINLLYESGLNETQKEYAAIANRSAAYLLQIVNDILDISKIESGRVELNNDDIDIFNFMSGIMVQFKKETDARGIDFIFEFDAGINSIVIGDHLRLKQIFINLLSNAVKYTEKGNIKLSVEKVCETGANITLKFYVCDTGIGIQQDQIKNLFHIFGQLDTSMTKKIQGTGLGLSIVKKLLDLMDGKIEVKSVFNEGTTFEITLNFKKHGRIELFEKKEFGLKFQKIKSLPALKALVAEDNYANAYLCRFMLEKLGVDSDIAENGKIAVEKFMTGRYNFVLMDIQMPELNGFDAAGSINKICVERGITSPIIALTAYARETDRQTCFKYGMAAYISKPFTLEELVSVIEKVLFK